MRSQPGPPPPGQAQAAGANGRQTLGRAWGSRLQPQRQSLADAARRSPHVAVEYPPCNCSCPCELQARRTVWDLHAAQHRADAEHYAAMLQLLTAGGGPASAATAAAVAVSAGKPAAASPPSSPASVLVTPARHDAALSKESLCQRLVGLVRAPSTGSTASADSIASHPVDASELAEAEAAAAACPPPPSAGRLALQAAAALLVLVAVAAAAVATRTSSRRQASKRSGVGLRA